MLVEYNPTEKMFSRPDDERTEQYVTGTVRLMSEELRSEFHVKLNEINEGIARLSAGVTELIPRATEILLDRDLEGAEYLILGDEEYDRRLHANSRSAASAMIALQAPVASDLRRLVGGDQDHRRRRALGRPVRQHLPRRRAASTATSSTATSAA